MLDLANTVQLDVLSNPTHSGYIVLTIRPVSHSSTSPQGHRTPSRICLVVYVGMQETNTRHMLGTFLLIEH